MTSIFRTLLLCQKMDNGPYKIFYGHSIYWKLSELDYQVDSWKAKRIRGDIYVFFIDFPDRLWIDSLMEYKQAKITSNNKELDLVFDWENQADNFLMNDNEDNDFKPFISLCSKVKYYFSEIESEKIEGFLQTKKSAIADIDNEFFIPLAKYPYLINTFSIYNPTRIETYLKNQVENKSLMAVTFVINDTFAEYKSCDVKYLLKSAEKEITGTFQVHEAPRTIPVEFDPDYMHLEIKNGADLIYAEKSHFIKSIQVNLRAVTGNIRTANGSVSSHTSSSFTIGGSDV